MVEIGAGCVHPIDNEGAMNSLLGALGLVVGMTISPVEAIISPSAILDVGTTIGDLFGTTTDVIAAADLARELEIIEEAQSSADPTEEKIRRISDLARDLGYTEADVAMWTRTLREDGPRAEKLRAITSMVKSAKALKKRFSGLTTQAKIAEVEQASLARQQLAVSTELLSEIQHQDLNMKIVELQKEQEGLKKIENVRIRLSSLGGRFFKSGALSFPAGDLQVESAIAMAQKLRPSILGFIVTIILARIAFYLMGFYPAYKHFDALRDGVLAIVLLYVFPDVVRATVHIGSTIGGALPADGFSDPGRLWKARGESWANTVALPASLVMYGIYSVAGSLVKVSVGIIVLFVPIAILLSQVMNFSRLWSLWIGSLVVLSLWPALWNGIGSLSSLLLGPAGDYALLQGAVLSVVQVAAPFLAQRLLGAQSPGVDASQNATQMISRATQVASRASHLFWGGSPVASPNDSSLGQASMEYRGDGLDRAYRRGFTMADSQRDPNGAAAIGAKPENEGPKNRGSNAV